MCNTEQNGVQGQEIVDDRFQINTTESEQHTPPGDSPNEEPSEDIALSDREISERVLGRLDELETLIHGHTEALQAHGSEIEHVDIQQSQHATSLENLLLAQLADNDKLNTRVDEVRNTLDKNLNIMMEFKDRLKHQHAIIESFQNTEQMVSANHSEIQKLNACIQTVFKHVNNYVEQVESHTTSIKEPRALGNAAIGDFANVERKIDRRLDDLTTSSVSHYKNLDTLKATLNKLIVTIGHQSARIDDLNRLDRTAEGEFEKRLNQLEETIAAMHGRQVAESYESNLIQEDEEPSPSSNHLGSCSPTA